MGFFRTRFAKNIIDIEHTYSEFHEHVTFPDTVRPLSAFLGKPEDIQRCRTFILSLPEASDAQIEWLYNWSTSASAVLCHGCADNQWNLNVARRGGCERAEKARCGGCRGSAPVLIPVLVAGTVGKSRKVEVGLDRGVPADCSRSASTADPMTCVGDPRPPVI
jgi:hypothetical protein